MKLFYVVGSANCRKVEAVANHLGIELQKHYLGFFNGDLRSPDYLGLNPNGRVPALVDGDFTLWESNAITQYLADRTPGQTLLPKDPRGRADVLRWQCWELAHYNRALGQLVWETIAKPNFLKQAPDLAVAEWAKAQLRRDAAVLEAHLEGRRYLVGEQITLADYALIHLEGFKEAAPFDWSPYPNVNAYYERMREVPHWSRTAAPSVEAIGQLPRAA